MGGHFHEGQFITMRVSIVSLCLVLAALATATTVTKDDKKVITKAAPVHVATNAPTEAPKPVKTEAPKPQPPKTEAPKPPPPKTEAPKPQPPKTEAPKPKTEAPKPEPTKKPAPEPKPQPEPESWINWLEDFYAMAEERARFELSKAEAAANMIWDMDIEELYATVEKIARSELKKGEATANMIWSTISEMLPKGILDMP